MAGTANPLAGIQETWPAAYRQMGIVQVSIIRYHSEFGEEQIMREKMP